MSDQPVDILDKPSSSIKNIDSTIVIGQLTRYGEQIGKEFTLVNDRMTWMVVAESFIFAAFATSAAGYSESGDMAILIIALLILMPALGILLSFSVIRAIAAAHQAAEYLKIGREQFEKEYLLKHMRIRTITIDRDWHREGNKPAQIVPLIIIIVWVLLLLVTSWVMCTRLYPISRQADTIDRRASFEPNTEFSSINSRSIL